MIYIIFLFFLMLGLWYLFFKKSKHSAHSPLNNSNIALNSNDLAYKLRKSIYNIQTQIQAFEEDIDRLYQETLTLLEAIAKPTFVPLPSQILYFQAIHPFKKENRYYYVRDINNGISEAELTAKKQTLENLHVQIEVALSKWTLHKELLNAHEENLQTLESLETHKNQLQKENLSALSKSVDTELINEKNTQYALHLLTEINEELQHRAEYLKQYILLQESFGNSDSIQANQVYKIKIDEMIQQLNHKS